MHWSRVMHIWVSKFGLRQPIIWASAGMLLILPFEKNHWNINQNSYLSIEEKESEYVVCQNGDVLVSSTTCWMAP